MRGELFHRRDLSRILRLVATVAALLLCACSPSPRLADRPIDLSAQATLVRFQQPVPASDPSWEVCFEFGVPGDSHRAGRIGVVLLSTTGTRYTLDGAELDRRGEAVVCQIGRLTAADPSLPAPEPLVFDAAELTSEVPMRIKGLRGGGRP